MANKREKAKWLAALLLCMTCLALCLTMLTTPTLAEPDGEEESSSTSESSSEESSDTTAPSTSIDEFSSLTATDTTAPSSSTQSSSSTSASTESTAAPAAHYKPVSGYQKLFEIVDAEGGSMNPPQFVYNASNDPSKGTNAKCYPKDGKYYAEFLNYSNIYLCVKADGALDYLDAIWTGFDQTWGTPDDVAARYEKNDQTFYHQLRDALGNLIDKWDLIVNQIPNMPGHPDYSAPGSSTTASTGTTTGGGETSSTTNPFFSTTSSNNTSLMPETSSGISIGIAVCVVVLLMGCGYCGYRFFRKEGAGDYYYA
ncbi:MAG: hypothetical protein FWH26_04620 [Oscillospiraceae bacterium]|nr:hypothetical protein [Oscillospiraceae bacterium]